MPVVLRLSLFYAAYFLGGGIQLPFWPVWLTSRGLGPGEIGVLLAIGQWIKIAATPLTGALADRAGDPRRMMLLLSLMALAGFLLCIPARGFAALVLLNALTAACLSAVLPIGESLALAAAERGGTPYGRIRIWGTLSFILATVTGGSIFGGRGPELILYLIIGLTALAAWSCFLLPRAATHLHEAKSGAWRLMLTRRHLLFITAVTLITASHSVYYAFGTLYWQSRGYSDTTIAWLWAEGAMAEAVLFYYGAPLVKRLGPATLIALGGAGGAVRWTALGLTASLPVLLVAQLLHAGTIAAVHLGAMYYLSRTIPPRHAATGQAFYSAAVGGVGFGLVMLASGVLYGRFGADAYFAMAVLSALGTALAVLLARLVGRSPTTNS